MVGRPVGRRLAETLPQCLLLQRKEFLGNGSKRVKGSAIGLGQLTRHCSNIVSDTQRLRSGLGVPSLVYADLQPDGEGDTTHEWYAWPGRKKALQ